MPKTGLARPPPTQQTARKGRLNFLYADVTFLAAYGAIQHLEGPPIEGAVILRFPTMQAARDWYDSPAYQTIAAQRFAGSRYRAFIIEGRR
ncbi:DUF1330 domain-containing protein [Brevundimonas sp. BH3]|uniref:DUF1330 domain-containing protein n=1 Tax=Brevundimonas sp. BH3 TaxID=3133089 RepID=UPI00387835DF